MNNDLPRWSEHESRLKANERISAELRRRGLKLPIHMELDLDRPPWQSDGRSFVTKIGDKWLNFRDFDAALEKAVFHG